MKEPQEDTMWACTQRCLLLCPWNNDKTVNRDMLMGKKKFKMGSIKVNEEHRHRTEKPRGSETIRADRDPKREAKSQRVENIHV